ncbi:ribosomal protein S5 domain 2-type protein [Polychytrium aggregatum]|uniref:ribosomal protein S5 domain 2-type protein n=1 Tax=Polychytrium aggregatum TaxID=110093 RepID=UPI0022FE97DC|nr:ribosomal protein S5 domain 2-type protein [Polychytrium aggregatum]KAI9205342.1 ribosomal protein S5 domain 2-type protein [Polychytrium aggregatum]
MTAEPLVFSGSLADVYFDDEVPAQRERYQALKESFHKRFGVWPDFYARCPGRVNIIGEHIDYSGYSVFPMAVSRDVVIAVASLESSMPVQVTVANQDPRYTETSFQHQSDSIVHIDSSVHDWINYFKCGYKGLLESHGNIQPRGFRALVDGNIPTGAGLSSSSAFVCCSALATMQVNGIKLSKLELTQRAIEGEQHAGVKIGGMDQTACVNGVKEQALLIDFVPVLRATPVSFQPVASSAPVFVIANTRVVADKHVTAPTNYNLRVVETRMAAAILAKHANLHNVATLRDFHKSFILDQYGDQSQGLSDDRQLQIVLAYIDTKLKPGYYSLEDVAAELQTSVAQVRSRLVADVTIRASGFQLHSRAKHVFSEARRVYQFRDLLISSDDSSGDLLKELGELMNQSQASCSDLFHCSCPEIDELVEICRRSGALGSRLTGAGWGGCVVSLVQRSDLDRFLDHVQEEYFFRRWPEMRGDGSISNYLFATRACSGAALLPA